LERQSFYGSTLEMAHVLHAGPARPLSVAAVVKRDSIGHNLHHLTLTAAAAAAAAPASLQLHVHRRAA